MAPQPTISEAEFTRLARQTYERIQSAFDDVDPDTVECDGAQDALTLTLPGDVRWIVSRQPPVRQLWLAVASRGRAYHFDYDAARGTWEDDKGQVPDLLTYLAQLLREDAGLEISF